MLFVEEVYVCVLFDIKNVFPTVAGDRDGIERYKFKQLAEELFVLGWCLYPRVPQKQKWMFDEKKIKGWSILSWFRVCVSLLCVYLYCVFCFTIYLYVMYIYIYMIRYVYWFYLYKYVCICVCSIFMLYCTAVVAEKTRDGIVTTIQLIAVYYFSHSFVGSTTSSRAIPSACSMHLGSMSTSTTSWP